MRIAMIGQKRTGSREGGVEVVVTELATRMVALGHEVTCYDRSGTDINGNETPSEPYEYKGVHVVPVKTVNAKGLAALSSAYFATRAAIKSQPDVIHYHAEGPCNALPLARKAGIRTVATIHGLDWKRAKWGGIAAKVIKRGERAAVKHADEIVVLSRAIQNYFMNEYERNTVFIPNGVEAKQPRPANAIQEKWGLTKGSYILYLGRVVPEKRADLLLDAFRGLDTDKSLVIAGGSSDSSEYFERIQSLAAKDPRVLMTDFVEGETLAELYSNAYCYVLPSDVEGMPMSLLEAMSYGCCCVTSDIPECADVISDSGLTFSCGNVTVLQRVLTALFDDSAHVQAMGKNAAKYVINACNWDRVVAATLELYKDNIR